MTLRLRGVRYRYAGSSHPVIDGLDLDVEAGEVLGVVGPNDAGKTTLCLIAAGLAPGSIGGHLEGSVLLDGRESRELRPYEAAERCGIVFQNPLTQLSGSTETVWEEVAFGPRNLGLGVAEIVSRVDGALAAVAITALEARNPAHLSGGQAQLVALASMLAVRPPVLVLDEPTSLLDPAGTRLVGDALARLARESGMAMLLVEHKTDLLARLATRVLVMADGKVALEGPARAVLADLRLPELRVDPPGAVTIQRAVANAGLASRLASLDLDAFDRMPVTVTGAGPTNPTPAAERTPRADPAVETAGLGFRYPDGTEALASVDLAIGRGACVALVGQNGSGKTTLVRHFDGLLRPTRGVVRIAGRSTAQRHVAELAHDVGLAFQNPDRQVFARRARDEVAFGARNLGRRGSELEQATLVALASVGLDGDADTNPFDLGFSKRKLLTIASVLAMNTPIVILDEPTTGQDAWGIARVRDVIEALRRDGRTVIAITHDMRIAAELFDRVIVMRQGAIALDGPPDEVFAESAWPVLSSTFLEPPLSARVGAALGLGSTPTSASLVAALAASGPDGHQETVTSSS